MRWACCPRGPINPATRLMLHTAPRWQMRGRYLRYEVRPLLFELAREIVRGRLIEALAFVIIAVRHQEPLVPPLLHHAGGYPKPFGDLPHGQQTSLAQTLEMGSGPMAAAKLEDPHARECLARRASCA